MNKLFGANFVRLVKDKIFWIGIIAMVGMAIFILFTCYRNQILTGEDATIDGGFFLHMQFLGVVIASFCSMFVGTEYSDGTIRNKLVVGHFRRSVYLSNLAIVVTAGILMSLSYIVVIAIVGIPVFGIKTTRLDEFLFGFLASSMVIIAFSSIFTMLSMCIQNRTVVMNITIIGFFVLMFISVFLFSGLSEEATWESYIYKDSVGNIITVPEEPNPNYISGMKREVYTFLLDFLPTGQDMQLASTPDKVNWWLPVYSLIITVVTSIGGMACFYKKDIK